MRRVDPAAAVLDFGASRSGIDGFLAFRGSPRRRASRWDEMAKTDDDLQPASDFARELQTARARAGLSPRKLARASGVKARRLADLEAGIDQPTDRELGALAQGCGVSVFDLLPPGYSLRVLVRDDAGAKEVQGRTALDALLREYLQMVLELRSGRAITPPTLRHDDLVELASALGDTPESIEQRLIELLGTEPNAAAIRSLILPSSAAG
jgi:transcriptional regulator with XRE-family HTH domain